MLRRTRAHRNPSSPAFAAAGGDDSPIPTQEYIRRAVEDENEDDDCFKRNPWLCALEFVAQPDGVIPCTPLNALRNCVHTRKVDQVLGLIKSCRPNGFGDLMVALKDPSGNIGATVHRKVLAECEFGKDITPGSVLILQKVAIFVPSPSARYLNITLGNVVKVFHKDIGPPRKQNHPEHVFPVTESVCRRDNVVQQKSSSLGREYADMRGKVHFDKQSEKEIILSGSSHCTGSGSSRNRNQNASLEKEPLSRRKIATEEIIDKAFRKGSVSKNSGTFDGVGECHSSSSSSIQHPTDGGNVIVNGGIEEDRRPITSRASSLPEWTDEQLNQLFAIDDESFF